MTDFPSTDAAAPDDAPGLAKTFDPAAIEARWYAHWEANGLFRPDRPDAAPYTIVNPPPNVTGSLHIGHALDNTLQDIMVRYERLRGRDALWVVGMDHAGIATQMVVERNLAADGIKRTDLGRDAFIDKVWQWKADSGGTITGQLRRLGCSMDWSREQFTMDPHFSRAVTHVFVEMHRRGLIYRDKRLVNWDPKLGTAISDLEVETREVQGHFWHIRYPLADGAVTASGADHIIVATTRPETLLADMAVAVNPGDERYAALVAAGAYVILPITGRRIPIIADDHADPELGSGAVKITPGHDFNDFEVGKRAGFAPAAMLNMLDARAHVAQTADGLIPVDYLGLERFAARKAVVAALEGAGLLDRIEDRVIQTPYGDRGGVVIEPWLTDQWYVDAARLAGPAIEAVRSGAVEIVPKSWEKTFFNWMETIQPWCVSRQLWWGHRIPVWYGPPLDADGHISFIGDVAQGHPFVAATPEEAVALARAFYDVDLPIGVSDDAGAWVGANKARYAQVAAGEDPDFAITLVRDPDVLDTWFSSALWPFATLGWPDAVADNAHTVHPEPVGGEGSALTPQTVRPEPVEGPSFLSAPEKKDGASTSSARTVLEEPARPDLGEQARPELGEPASPDFAEQGRAPTLLAKHYPNDLLISGFDILFFWDARMLMQGIELMGTPPWKRLYLHGLVRAADGQKMSKSKGNVVDPLGLIDRFGADALRFFMAAMESQGRDVKMDEARVEGYRNFATKLWNAVRFAQSNGIGASASVRAPAATLPLNRWLIGEVAATAVRIEKSLADLRFDAAATAIYQFVWDRFCDWYLELSKPVFAGGGAAAEETRAVAGWAIDQILVMLHPFMPFITEELWHAQGARAYELIVAKWPDPRAEAEAQAAAEIGWLIGLIGGIRTAKSELGLPPGARLTAHAPGADGGVRDMAARNGPILDRLARLDMLSFDPAPAGAAAAVVVGGVTYALPLEGVIDVGAERGRLSKALAAASKERDSLSQRLANPAFTEKAKPEAIDKARADYAGKTAEAERLAAALARLG